MIQERLSVFETNSSSTHTLTLENRELCPSQLPIDKNGYVIITLEDFNCSGTVQTQSEKLAWLILQGCSEAGCYLSNRYDDTTSTQLHKEYSDSLVFDRIKNAICEYTGAKGIRFKRGTTGSIDHQSQYSSINEFLEEMNLTLEEWIFSSVYLTLGRD